MKKLLCIIVLGLVGCGPAGEGGGALDVGEGDGALVAAEDLPSFANAVFTVAGEQEPLYGSVQLHVAADGAERYVITADGRTGGASLHGEIDLRGELAPTPVAEGKLETRYRAEGDYAWLGDNRGGFTVRTERGASAYALRVAEVRVDALGRFVARLEGVGNERIDAKARRILPGTDRVVEIHGRLLGTCMTALPTGATVMDPRNQTPRCNELFAKL